MNLVNRALPSPWGALSGTHTWHAHVASLKGVLETASCIIKAWDVVHMGDVQHQSRRRLQVNTSNCPVCATPANVPMYSLQTTPLGLDLRGGGLKHITPDFYEHASESAA